MKSDRAIYLKVLLALRPYLGPRSLFVCNSAHAARRDKRISNLECDKFVKMISERIGNHPTVIVWLEDALGIYTGATDWSEFLVYRKRWVDAMIKEFTK